MRQEAATTVACVQFEPVVGDAPDNRRRALELVEESITRGANLVVLPELSDSGYVFESRAEAFALAEPADRSQAVAGWIDIARKGDIHIVGGFCEREGNRLFNSAAIIGPDGLLSVFRKLHLWGEEALYFERGDRGVPVVTTPFGRIAALICYDGWFPEAWRLAALQGADLVAVPTNWVPMPSQPDDQPAMSNILCMAAAHSNSLFVAAACRTGVERGQPFIGQSLIVSHEGWPVAGPAAREETCVLVAELNLADARRKRALNNFNQVMRDRRTDVYDEMLGAAAEPGWY